MIKVEFETPDLNATRNDFTILSITAEFAKVGGKRGKVCAAIEDDDKLKAFKLHAYIESHHVSETRSQNGGTVIRTLPVAGWNELCEAAGLPH